MARAAYAGLQDHAFAVAEARNLEALRHAATVTRIEADLALGRHRDVVEELGQLVESVIRARRARLRRLPAHWAAHQAGITATVRKLLARTGPAPFEGREDG